MFTGIITHTTPITAHKAADDGLTITFARPKDWDDITLGESIATDGVCLTVAGLRDNSYDCFLMHETLAKTSFGSKIPDKVNLERSLSVNDRFGGHFVQGHVDGLGLVTKVQKGDDYRIYVEFPTQFAELVIYKGSITINGVSLTVASVEDNTLSVALIPHTLEHTTLGILKKGDNVNLEFDVIGKYVAKIMSAHR